MQKATDCNSRAQRSEARRLGSRTTEENSNKLKRNSTHAGDPESPSTYKMGVATPLPSEAQREAAAGIPVRQRLFPSVGFYSSRP